ncbi:hypothetical protein PVL29_006955 [Vitis rotundifolia]|uniref:Uncharacterized protein n=1 Tax=Vitis rotundifolia TaxID=103349 RepID=A0AA39A7C0_VITRO|nr:hypothetical protein PVL29_006955 [Vitis rotundifolia]
MTTPLRLMLPLTTASTTATFSFSSFSSKSVIFFQSPSPSLSSPSPNPFNPFPSYYSFSSSQSHRRCVPEKGSSLSSRHKWICGHMRKDQDRDSWRDEEENPVRIFCSDEEVASQVPTQAQSVVEGSGAVLVSEFKPVPDVDYLQELLAIQQQGPRAIGFFGTRNMGFTHQELIEILSYAMVITKNHIFTSGASGTNAAVIRGALRAEKPELLTVILPQSLKMQPPESQELLSKVKNVIEKPYNDHLPLIEASRLCNMDIISHVQQVICFAFHDSKLLMETCQEAKNLRKIVTLFYLD